MSDTEERNAELMRVLLDTTNETWRFSRLFHRVLTKVPHDEATRYHGQFRFFERKLHDSLQRVGIQVVNLEGLPYEPGMAVSVVNMDEFGSEDELIVEQMLEPIIKGEDGILQEGSIRVKRVMTWHNTSA